MKETLSHYERNAAREAGRYESISALTIETVLERWIPRGARVLELGCGSGRDARRMAARGVRVTATDGSEEMLRIARNLAKDIEGIRFQKLPLPPRTPEGDVLRTREKALAALGASAPFDALVAIGVLQHLDDAGLFDAALFIDAVLGDAGTIVLSIPENHATATAEDPRFYANRPAAHYSSLLSRFGFEEAYSERRESTGAPGKECTWVTLVFVRRAERLRAVSRLRGILEDEAKTATYKFALLRAVADVNIEAPGRARFLARNEWQPVAGIDADWVAIPFSLVVERWLDYFWELTAGTGPAPRQIQGSRPLGFGASLSRLQALYAGDRLHFRRDFYEGRLALPDADPAKVKAFFETVIDIAEALKKGPVYFTGSKSSDGKPFYTSHVQKGAWAPTPAGLARHFGELRLPVPLWNELNRSAPWFVNTVMLEWARLSVRFSQLAGEPATTAAVLARLLPPDAPDRDTVLAKAVYEGTGDLHCVWTDRPLTRSTLAVDHMIPWARTHCNDLWNLLPADRGANGKKSDRLPTLRLLDEARPRLFRAWRTLEDARSALFRAQAENTLLRTSLPKVGWEKPLFDAVLRTADDTARQFGAPRWDGLSAGR